MEKLNKLKKVIKKGVKVGVLGAGLAASTMLFNSCSNPNGPQNPEQPGYEIPKNPEDKNYCQPYDVVMGNGNYVIHCFEGDATSSAYATMAEDMNYYLGKGETYVKGLVDDFSTSLQGRPGAQAYFDEFITEQKNNEFKRLGYYPNKNNPNSNPNGFDVTVNRISLYSEPIFEDIIRNIDNNRDRFLFIRCYQALSMEAYKYGLGKYKNDNNNQMRYYNSEREEINESWTASTIGNPFDINQDIDQSKCLRITQTMDNLLNQVVNKMNNGITVNDLQRVINISTTANSLAAMDDLSAHALDHDSCGINLGIVSAMYELANEMFKQEQQNLSSMTK